MTVIKSFTAVCLCFTQLGLGILCSGALADTTTPAQAATATAPGSEFTLLENVIALQGQKLSQQAMETRLSTLLTQYASTLQTQGQAQRLEQAMVDLHVYTPAQAAALTDQVTREASATDSGTDLSTGFPAALSNVLANAPAGAQFSGCAIGGGLLVGVSAFVLLIGYALDKYALDAGDTPGNDRALIIGGSGMAAGITLIVMGSDSVC